MKPVISSLFLLLLLNGIAHTTDVVIKPASASSSTEINATRSISDSLDGVLLSAGGTSNNILEEVASYAGSNGHWLSAITSIDDDANFRSTTEELIFTLGSPESISKVHIWPYIRAENIRGLKTFDISFSFDGGTSYPTTISAASLGDFTIGPTGGTDAVQTKSFSPQNNVTHIKLTNLTSFGSTNYLALSEIRFGKIVPNGTIFKIE
jgi:hypothetical protein